ncbi:hypothetical protein AMTRI_Chr01g135550 [Amborella trichopoda]|uniref:Aminotransferase class I/classII large domain-containing protein n=1 Tax=Amborella trichopoda TaxID=13333 RepID=W1P8J7_AMBTC|nr:hypothetical protein AMTR_s00389p00012170 [Amborella trichopoda]
MVPRFGSLTSSQTDWEVDLDAVEALADSNTAAIVIVNPVNPCGNIFSYEHLSKVAETAKKLGILVISDEVYAHLSFGDRPFVPMGVLVIFLLLLLLALYRRGGQCLVGKWAGLCLVILTPF